MERFDYQPESEDLNDQVDPEVRLQINQQVQTGYGDDLELLTDPPELDANHLSVEKKTEQ